MAVLHHWTTSVDFRRGTEVWANCQTKSERFSYGGEGLFSLLTVNYCTLGVFISVVAWLSRLFNKHFIHLHSSWKYQYYIWHPRHIALVFSILWRMSTSMLKIVTSLEKLLRCAYPKVDPGKILCSCWTHVPHTDAINFGWMLLFFTFLYDIVSMLIQDWCLCSPCHCPLCWRSSKPSRGIQEYWCEVSHCSFFKFMHCTRFLLNILTLS